LWLKKSRLPQAAGSDRHVQSAFPALHSINLKTLVKQTARLSLPLVVSVRSRTVANVDSIGLVVRMCSAKHF